MDRNSFIGFSGHPRMTISKAPPSKIAYYIHVSVALDSKTIKRHAVTHLKFFAWVKEEYFVSDATLNRHY